MHEYARASHAAESRLAHAGGRAAVDPSSERRAGNRAITTSTADNGHKGLMPVITPRLTGHNAHNAPGIIGSVAEF